MTFVHFKSSNTSFASVGCDNDAPPPIIIKLAGQMLPWKLQLKQTIDPGRSSTSSSRIEAGAVYGGSALSWEADPF